MRARRPRRCTRSWRIRFCLVREMCIATLGPHFVCSLKGLDCFLEQHHRHTRWMSSAVFCCTFAYGGEGEGANRQWVSRPASGTPIMGAARHGRQRPPACAPSPSPIKRTPPASRSSLCQPGRARLSVQRHGQVNYPLHPHGASNGRPREVAPPSVGPAARAPPPTAAPGRHGRQPGGACQRPPPLRGGRLLALQKKTRPKI